MVTEPTRSNPLADYADAIGRIKRLADPLIGTASMSDRLGQIRSVITELEHKQRDDE